MYEERNRKIKESGKATRERRANMDCRVFSVKIQENRLSKAKSEKLKRCFLEAKWLYNAILATETLTIEDTSIVQVKVKDTFEEREIKCLSWACLSYQCLYLGYSSVPVIILNWADLVDHIL